jgi:hypothetical protein
MTTEFDLKIPRVPAGSEKLIQEGAVSYVQATIALNQFRGSVLDVCEELAKGRLEDINKIVGTNFSEDDLRPWPQKGKSLDSQDPWVCVYVTLRHVVSIDIGLYWESLKGGGYRLHAVTAFEFWDQALFQEARQKVDENKDVKFGSFPYGDQDRFISLSEAIPEEQATSFPEKLQNVLDAFLVGWEKVGGLKNRMEDRSKGG